jgi:hypothetical protein
VSSFYALPSTIEADAPGTKRERAINREKEKERLEFLVKEVLELIYTLRYFLLLLLLLLLRGTFFPAHANRHQ